MEHVRQEAWDRSGRSRQWIDYPTMFIAVAWCGMMLLWPEMPVTDAAAVPRTRALVAARTVSGAAIPLFRRPDLIARPSEASFAPSFGVDAADRALDFDRRDLTRTTLLQREWTQDRTAEVLGGVALAAEAVRAVSRARPPVRHALWAPGSPLRPTPLVSVAASDGLGDVDLSWSSADTDALFRVDHAWEVELSVTIADDGMPGELFLEKRSGDPPLDRALIRALSRPETWKQASGGRGTLLVSFSPIVAKGMHDED